MFADGLFHHQNALSMIGEGERELFLLFASLYGRTGRVQSGQLTVQAAVWRRGCNNFLVVASPL